MAPLIHHLVSLSSEAVAHEFIAALRNLPESQKPLWVGKCQHWIHDPHLSVDALTGSGSDLKKWDYLIILQTNGLGAFDLPPGIDTFVSDKWSITAEVADNYVDELPGKDRRLAAAPAPTLPDGWSTSNYDALDASQPPADLNTSLGTKAPVMGQDKKGSQIDLKTFVRTFGTSAAGASSIAMFNLLSFFPGKVAEYFKYVSGFMEVLGPATGGQPLTAGFEVHDWSSKKDDKGDPGVWEQVNLIWYPSIWYFGQMVADEKYAKLDRDFKTGVVRDNPILCCTPVDLDTE